MTRKVLAALGWRSAVLAALLLATTPSGSPAARQHAATIATGSIVDASENAAFQSASWLRPQRGGVEIQLDALLREVSAGGALRLDRAALARAAQDLLGDGAETLTLNQALDRLGRVHVTSQGMSVVLGRRTQNRLLRALVGTDGRFEAFTVGELLDSLAGSEVTSHGVRGRLDHEALASALRSVLPRARRPDHSGDEAFARRADLQRQYREVTTLVGQLRREGFKATERNALYDEAYARLVKANRADAAPLLDAHLRLEEAMAAARAGTDGRAQRIASRWEARRNAFGDETAVLLFGRQEAMERYEIDRLAIAADAATSEAEKARMLQERRLALKVELAGQGSYVSFPDKLGASGEPPGSAPARGGRRQ